MHDSVCRLYIVKKAKTFLNSCWGEKMQNLDWSMQISFFEMLNHNS